jgi:Fe-S cluster assembly ATP-binding protein
MERQLQIKKLKVNIKEKPILKGVDLEIKTGEIHALMGPNGSGKSTLASVLLGHPAYRVTGGSVVLNGKDILSMGTHERAREGLFLAFQYPIELPGVTVGKFLKRAVEIKERTGSKLNVSAYISGLRETLSFLEMDQQFINRYLNQGFSGGEKKRMEILQLLMLKPSLAILDETDSGLDIDALKIVAKGINSLRGDGFGALIITHYKRILNYVKPDYVHVMYNGSIVASGGSELVETLEDRGYEWIKTRSAEEEHDEQHAVSS